MMQWLGTTSLLVLMASMLAVLAPPAAAAESDLREIVFGSFLSPDNAEARADAVGEALGIEVRVERTTVDGQVFHRVLSPAMPADDIWPLTSRAADQRIEFWTRPATTQTDAAVDVRPRDPLAAGPDPGSGTGERAPPATRTAPDPASTVPRTASSRTDLAPDTPSDPAPRRALRSSRWRADSELGLQLRGFPESGLAGQARLHPSVGVNVDVTGDFNDGAQRLAVDAFVRIDGQDGRRSHGDLRQAYVSHVADAWELHAGLRRVFWGRTESKHLVDVLNQVDLVEDIDEEARLGQPMVQLTLLRDLGVLDLFLLTGFRERTFPGPAGRLTGPFRIDGEVDYRDGAGRDSLDLAVRWSHYFGPLEFGIAHFSGVGREPELALAAAPVAGEPIALRPVYLHWEQTSIDAQLITGAWAWKLEAFSRRRDGERFGSFVAGFERTWVGIGGSRWDLGLLGEALWDERDEAAPILAFEHHGFLGMRLAANDMAGSQALIGVIRDVHSDETLVSVEASRRLGASWRLALEARWFGRGESAPPGAVAWVSDPDLLWGSLGTEDYVQLEVSRYF